jgi:hypothetical protein
MTLVGVMWRRVSDNVKWTVPSEKFKVNGSGVGVRIGRAGAVGDTVGSEVRVGNGVVICVETTVGGSGWLHPIMIRVIKSNFRAAETN